MTNEEIVTRARFEANWSLKVRMVRAAAPFIVANNKAVLEDAARDGTSRFVRWVDPLTGAEPLLGSSNILIAVPPPNFDRESGCGIAMNGGNSFRTRR